MRRYSAAKGKHLEAWRWLPTEHSSEDTDPLAGHLSTDLSKMLQKYTQSVSKCSGWSVDMKLEDRPEQVSMSNWALMMLRLLFDELKLLEKERTSGESSHLALHRREFSYFVTGCARPHCMDYENVWFIRCLWTLSLHCWYMFLYLPWSLHLEIWVFIVGILCSMCFLTLWILKVSVGWLGFLFVGCGFLELEITAVILFPKPHTTWADFVFHTVGVWRSLSF